ncbi:hypothetical protein [Saccharopolyspora spinosa]|uniref:hypothetical protein n=1 Tax=Saccharopolyspora spinosa TaxID=60894 RepID=UPI001ED8CC91|nr:hypothetical protein [Saccharopolyspora spinosa]
MTGSVKDLPTLVVGLPEQSLLFPAPGASKAQVVAEAHSYQLYKDANLVVARMGPDGDGILLLNGEEIGFDEFANWLGHLRVGRNRDLWTVLAIPGAPAALPAEVVDVVEGPVLTTVEQVHKTPDGRLLAGVYETDQTGRVQFRPSNGGWMEFKTRDEGVWLEKLAEFLELLPLSEAGQAQVVQLFAWTRPWMVTGDAAGHSALVVGLPEQSVLFPGPGVSRAQVVAEAHSYQLYKYASLVVAGLAPDGNGIVLRDDVIDFESFAGLLKKRMVGRGNDLWTLLAIPGAPAALLAEVLDAVEGPVLATVEQVFKTPDGRLLAGV